MLIVTKNYISAILTCLSGLHVLNKLISYCFVGLDVCLWGNVLIGNCFLIKYNIWEDFSRLSAPGGPFF